MCWILQRPFGKLLPLVSFCFNFWSLWFYAFNIVLVELQEGAKLNIHIQFNIFTWKLYFLGLYFAQWKTSYGDAIFSHVHDSLSERHSFLF